MLQTLGWTKREQHSRNPQERDGCPTTLARDFSEASVWVVVLTISRKVRGFHLPPHRGCFSLLLAAKDRSPRLFVSRCLIALSRGEAVITSTGKPRQEELIYLGRVKTSLWTVKVPSEVPWFLRTVPPLGLISS